MSKIKLLILIFISLVAVLAAQAPVAAFTPAAPLPGIEGPGGVPHYFGPYGNWAYSPLPRGPVATVTVVDGGAGYTAPVVTISDAYITPTASADVTAIVSAGVITGFTINNGGADYIAPVVTITDPTGTGAIADAVIGGPLTGGIRKFIDKVPGLTPAGANSLLQPSGDFQYIPIAIADTTTFPNSDYYEIALVEFYEKMHSDLPPTKHRGYVQLETPAVLSAMAAMNPPLVSKHVAVGGGHFAIDNPHFLGPVIVARGSVQGLPGVPEALPVPVRLKFYNLLPTGSGGNLFLPVDPTVMGSGEGPVMGEMYTQNRATVHLHGNNTVWISDGTPHQWITPAGETTSYPKGVSVRNVPDMWFDPTTHAPVPAGTPGATNDPGDGAMTLFYTNAQSARLMFYHDHAYGITRLNVYAGEAAGYVITDAVEQDLINGTNVSGVNINCDVNNLNCAKVLPDIGIPLVIQDRTFVDANTIYAQDPTWNWGTMPSGTANTGDLWYPHVYMSAQNPWDVTGTNAFGRWHYGPWFIQPTPVCDINGLPVGCIDVGPVPNPYCLPQPPTTCVVNGTTQPDAYDCSAAPWEPPCMPGVPNPSMAGEAFMDTPIVNGTAYPYLEVEPKAYRFRILNAADDRMVNLQLYVAADKTTPTTPGTVGTVLCAPTPADPTVCTEVKMVPVSVAPANQFGDTPSGVPDPATKGPDWIQIGTEGGFMPKPVVVPSQPIGWNLNPTTFNFGNVNQHSLLLGSAERADVVVDFSGYAGKTLILYNDSPAAFPAGVPIYDYFTGVASQMDVGGAPTTQPGYGPNTRTIMQIRVGTSITTPTTDVTLANLNSVFAKGAAKRGVFEVSQDPIIIPQKAYQSAYNVTNFPSASASQYVQIADTQKTFQPINADGVLQPAVTIPLEQKAMHDEMGGVYDTQFGRMSGMLGLASLTSPVHNLIPYGYASPPVDIINGSAAGSQIGVLPDGTQIWRIFHNGVDTHTIHTHLFNSQLINRTGQDGIMLPPDPSELGWKDTFRINPLEVTWLAMRPTIPTPAQVPFPVPNSVRLIDPTMPEGAILIPPGPAGWFDPAGNPINQILNQYVNFGWEYVWHCHILAHEEMDMMHTMAFAVPPETPSSLTAIDGGGNVVVTWTDNSASAMGFTLQRATDTNFTQNLTTFPVGPSTGPGSTVTYTDTTAGPNPAFLYRVQGFNTVGSTVPGFPTSTVVSAWSNTAPIGSAPIAGVLPTSLNFGNQVVLTTSTPPLSLTLSNSGTAPLSLDPSYGIKLTGGNSGDFAISANTCGISVAAGGTCSISLTFTPTTVGARSASLTIVSNDPANGTLNVPLTGTGTANTSATITINAPTITYGANGVVTVSVTSPQVTPVTGTVTLSVDGGAPSSQALSNGSATYTLTAPTEGNHSLAANYAAQGGFQASSANGTLTVNPAPLTISATLNPATMIYGGTVPAITPTYSGFVLGQRAANLTGAVTCGTTATSTSPVSGNPYSSSCSGATSTNYAITYVPGVVTINQATSATTITPNLPNPSIVGQIVTASFSVAPQFIGTPGGTVNVTASTGENCTGALSAGAGSCTLTFNTGGTRTLTATYAGDVNFQTSTSPSVNQVVSGVSLSTKALLFGNQLVGTTSAGQTATLSNVGSTPITGISIGVTGDFTQSNNCRTTLAAGRSCSITVRFRPTATGVRVGSVAITDSDPTSPQTISLTGTGVQPVQPIATLSPSSYSFGNVTRGGSSSPFGFTLTNSGTGPLTINRISFGGANANQFRQTNNCGSSLAINASCTINVTFSPTRRGAQSATLQVRDNAPGSPQTANLTGTGL